MNQNQKNLLKTGEDSPRNGPQPTRQHFKQCKTCLETKTTDLFYKNTGKKGFRANCKTCHNKANQQWKLDNPDRAKELFNRGNKKRFGLTPEQYEVMVKSQNGVCAICQTQDILAIDHDHSCCPENLKSCGFCIRGLLCGKCNRAIGLFNENPEILRSALIYLEKYNETFLR